MITGIVGTFTDEFIAPLRGNGKGITQNYFGFADFTKGREIYSNYHTKFSIYKRTQYIIDMILNEDLQKVTILIDEIQSILNSLGSKGAQILFIDTAAAQFRKIECDLYWASQRWMNVNNRMRLQTENVLLPCKFHYEDDSACFLDRCKKLHYIEVNQVQPYIEEPIITLHAPIIGQLYDTNEMIIDELNLDFIKKSMKKRMERIEAEC
ncbi:hypothetical protein EHM76_00970 [bacterium]|nr:MAG: hypothetical protein EHM76_00970 [bacterium]